MGRTIRNDELAVSTTSLSSKEKKKERALRDRFGAAADALHHGDGSSYRRTLAFHFVLYLICVIVAALSVRQFIFEPSVVDGESMQDTLIDRERVFVEKISYWFETPSRGDIVIVRFPNRKGNFVKRIIALPGETIEIRKGYVYIDDERLDESAYAGDWYGRILPSRGIRTEGSVDGVYTVPQGYVFVMGDNRNDSHDSRAEDVGAIPIEDILGKAHFVIWPLSNIRGVND